MSLPPSTSLPPEHEHGMFRWLRPSHTHTAFSATLLLMLFAFLSRVIGLVRVKVIAYIFGAGVQTDAYNAAFELPEMINYFLVGGVASITFVTILNRYREAGQHEEGDRALSVILNTMLLVLGTGVLLAEVFASQYVRVKFPGFTVEQAALCTSLTRILLPAQLFFFTGGVLGATLLVRKQFAYQAVTPLVYNLGIILGGVLLARHIGVASLAWGALVGAFVGPLAMNAFGAKRAGVRYLPLLDFGHEGLHEWVKLSLPLILGFSLVTADNWIISYFASHSTGDITRLMTAKALFTAPIAILGQAAGAASLPFFASLWSQERYGDFAGAVNRGVSRLLAASLLLTAWMIPLAGPLVDLLFRGGSFRRHDATETATYFAVFAVSLALWASQAIYVRAFYAAGNTMTPMVAGTIITLLSIPVYWALFRWIGIVGLAVASDIGILTHTATLAVMLHRRGMVRVFPSKTAAGALEGKELSRALLASVAGYAAVLAVVKLLPHAPTHAGDGLILLAGTLVWIAVSFAMLKATGSALPQQLFGRFAKR